MWEQKYNLNFKIITDLFLNAKEFFKLALNPTLEIIQMLEKNYAV